jgi:hypothetical protein
MYGLVVVAHRTIIISQYLIKIVQGLLSVFVVMPHIHTRVYVTIHIHRGKGSISDERHL